MTEDDSLKIIKMHNITKTFPGVLALDKVNFDLKPGEIRGLVGKNGAGKTTLVSILTGNYPPTSGEIFVHGKLIHNMTTTSAKKLGISIVHQHSQLIPPLSMAENLFCGNLPKNTLRAVDWRRLYGEAQERIDQLGLKIDVRRTIEGASIAERQMIEIVKALFASAKIVVLDEATASLPKSEVDLLFSFVRRLRDQGVAFVYISHYLEEVFELCDNVTVMRDGRNLGDYAVSSLNQGELISLISGKKIETFKRQVKEKGGQPVLVLKDYQQGQNYQAVNLSLYPGEIVGITGLDGCGKDVIARSLFGMEPAGEGQALVEGKPVNVKEPKDAFKQGIAYLPRDRLGHGVVGMRPVRENITLPILDKLLNKWKLLRLNQEKNLISKLIQQLNIVTPSQEQPVQFLSGGNQQKVVFAKLVSVQPKILFLDEPTQGVDVQAKVEIMKIIDELSRNKMCVVIISEEIRELLEICDRILVMYKGKIRKEFMVGEAETTPEKIMMVVEGSAV